MKNNETEFLVKLGLPEKAANIYLALLDLGDASVSEIAQTADVHRTDVYRYIPMLIEKKLASTLEKGKRTLYRAGSPSSLENVRDEFLSASEAMFSRLRIRHEAKSLRAHLEHLKGIDAIANLYVDAMRLTPIGGNYLRYSSGNTIYNKSIYSSPEYERLKKQRRIGRLVIANSYFRKRKPDPDAMREVVEIPEGEFEVFNDNITKLIYADRVAVIDHDTLEAFVIQSERFAEYEAKIFRYFWKFLKERERL